MAPVRWLDRARGELSYAHYWARTENPINCSGALARVVLQTAHARLAHRGVWALNEKRMVTWAGLTDLNGAFAAIGSTRSELTEAIRAVEAAVAMVSVEVTDQQ